VVLSITTRQETQARADPPPTERPRAATVHAAGWYDDPSGQFDHRYWDGDHWTDHVTTRGVRSVAHVTPAGWYPDPTGRFHWRYWTGTEWTDHVSRDDELFVDPV